MKVIKDTELILTPENKVYHLNISKNEIAEALIFSKSLLLENFIF